MLVGSTLVGLLVCVAVVLHGNFVQSEGEYCEIGSCSSGQHTLCLYPDNAPAPSCENVLYHSLSQDEKTGILEKHNNARARVAKGLELRGSAGSQPPASNMRQLEWDNELAEAAQRWALQCADGRDTCRNFPNSLVGQNVGTRIGHSGSSFRDPFHVMINEWQYEVWLFNNNGIQSYRSNNRTLNYSQLVWANTSHVGCGGIVYEKDEEKYMSLVCNYAPAGNQVNESVYEIGPAASACPNGKGTVRGLCA